MTAKRRTKQTREELRAILLDAGREILFEEGIETGSSNLTFKRVFERVEKETGLRVTNASVIKRVWDNQADFQADVLVAIAHDEARPEAQLTVEAVASMLGTIDLSTPESSARSLQEVCRIGGSASTTAIADSSNFSLWISVMAMATTRPLPDERQRIQAALLEGYEAVSKFWEDVFAGLAAFLRVRIRPPWTMRQFVVAVTALNEGCSLRQRVSGHIDLIDRPTGPNGEDQEWTIFGAGLEALVNQFFEPDPGAAPVLS